MTLRSLPERYAIAKLLSRSEECEVFSGVRVADDAPIVAKLYLEYTGGESGARRARREHDMLVQVAGPGVPAVVELLETHYPPALVLERAPGISLHKWAQSGSVGTAAFLDVAIQLVAILERVHATRILHRDIKPSNVVLDPRGLVVSLVDFGIARPLGSSDERAGCARNRDGLVGTLQYMAPEQTGRMDRGVDPRSDLYSLGATLHHLLTGRPPFEADDPLALVHAHLAKAPPAVSVTRPGLPATLSRIILRLLQKSPEERYQTAHALRSDLLECRERHMRTGSIPDDLVLGGADAPFRPVFRGRLYGREGELEALLGGYAKACQGETVLLLLRGPAGMGKSTLSDALQVDLIRTQGYLARGKFDQYRRDVPYAAVLQVLSSLVQQMLAESDARLVAWRDKLMATLGSLAGALVERIGDLATLLPEVPGVPPLGPSETRARFGLAVQRFIAAVATREHPLVLFLDDLQWSDVASRELLLDLLQPSAGQALLVLGAYRDREADADAAIRSWLDHVESGALKPRTVQLAPLSRTACAQMLADALGRPLEQTLGLAARFEVSTGNTPLLIQQLVYHMYDRGLIRFEIGIGWTWDDSALAAAPIPDDAVELLRDKIERLPPDVGQVLKLASCMGHAFDAAMLVELSDLDAALVERALFCLCDEGLILPARSGFCLGHDRIREAAQSLVSAAERARMHRAAARLLIERTEPAEIDARVSEIADHLDLASSCLEEDDVARALDIYARAGRMALRSGAAAHGGRYFACARALLREEDWTSRRETAFQVCMSSAECAYQIGEYEVALQVLDALEGRARSVLESAQIDAKKIAILTIVRGVEKTVPIVLDALRRYGIDWPARPSRARVWLAIARADWALRGPIATAIAPARGGDHGHWLGPLLIMVAGGSCFATTSVRLMCLVTSHAICCYRRFGFLNSPGFAIASYAGYRQAFLGHQRGSERYAEAALQWNERLPESLYTHRTIDMVHTTVLSWTRPRRSVLGPLQRVMERTRELGDFEFSYYARSHRVLYSALVGESLESVEHEFKLYAQETRRRGIPDEDAYARAVRLLRDPPADPRALLAEVQSVDALIRQGKMMRLRPWPFWIEILCVLGDYERACCVAREASAHARDVGSNWSQMADYLFFWAVAEAQMASGRSLRAWLAGTRALRRSLRQLRTWARYGPDFVHMVWGLEAERARLRRRHRQALALYTRAAEQAIRCGYPPHAAFLHERRARLLFSLSRKTEGLAALRQARAFYDAWGAAGKATALARED